MPDMIEVLRKAQAYASRPSAIHRTDAQIQDAQRKADPHSSDLFALPCDFSQFQPLQDMDPSSDTYGLWYEVEGYDVPGTFPPRPGPNS